MFLYITYRKTERAIICIITYAYIFPIDFQCKPRRQYFFIRVRWTFILVRRRTCCVSGTFPLTLSSESRFCDVSVVKASVTSGWRKKIMRVRYFGSKWSLFNYASWKLYILLKDSSNAVLHIQGNAHVIKRLLHLNVNICTRSFADDIALLKSRNIAATELVHIFTYKCNNL